MHFRKMSKNYIFREFECGLSLEETAELCFKTVRTIKQWDAGKEIPKECRRLMRIHSRLELGSSPDWKGFKMHNNYLELPTGQHITAQQLIAGIALLSINSELELKTSAKILKFARAISQLRQK